jgi:phenylacetate-coenzyme A ligase PaaK-like adenylate-forming protein
VLRERDLVELRPVSAHDVGLRRVGERQLVERVDRVRENEARCRRWYGVSKNDRWAIFGGQLVTPVQQKKPPFWIWNAGMKQLYMSSYHLAPDSTAHYLDALLKYRVRYILGYPSANILRIVANSGPDSQMLQGAPTGT